MSYSSTYDEKATGFYSSYASDYSDAPYSTGTIFKLAEGSLKAAYGLLSANGGVADYDSYSMGTLSAGTYTVTAASSFWFYGSDYASYITPSVYIYDSQGNNINANGYSYSKTFTVTSSSTYYATVFGVGYQASQYQLSYSYTAPVNHLASAGTVSIFGTAASGSILSIAGTWSDADGLSSANSSISGYSYSWMTSVDGSSWTTVSTANTYRLTDTDSGKYIDCVISFHDDLGNFETVSPLSVLVAPLSIVGSNGPDVFSGGVGNDSISGRDGADWLYGGVGNDTLNGDAGNDYVYGQTGNDTLDGGDGADIVSGGDGNDIVHGGNGDDGIYGDAGNDAMFGDGGGDFIAGGDGADTQHGGDGQDWQYGEYGNDVIYGDAGNDFLFGNFGDDSLIGGTGNDTLIGGDGADTFVFAANDGEDFVTDFSVAQGDHISIASGTNGITTTAQALAHVHDVGGNAVVDLGGGNYVMLMGVTTASLHATDFVIGPAGP